MDEQPPSDGVRDVGLDSLSFGLSPREKDRDPDHVEVLAGVISHLPPILVHAESMRVIDGVHRVLAARSLGHQTVRASFFHGSAEEAEVKAILCNTTHGKPLTSTERRLSASRVLGLHPDWSDRRIASTCGLPPRTVAYLRQRATGILPQLRARVGRDGKARSTDPIEVRRRIAAALRADPSASIRAIAARTGAAQGTVRDVRHRMERGDNILSPRLADVVRRDEQADDQEWVDDQAFQSQQASAEFVNWFDDRRLGDDSEWQDYVDAVPVSRIYEIADAARRSARAWERFATAIESRVRFRKRA